MKKSVIIFVLVALVLLTTTLWITCAKFEWNISEIVIIGIMVIVAGYAIFIGSQRSKSQLTHKPVEDELTRKVTTKSSSLSFYISLYMWLFILYMSDRTIMTSSTLIGAGIGGMALIFLFCWIGFKVYGMKDE